MSDTVVSVSYERKFSDGQYGSEGMSLSWTVTYEDETDLACDSEVVEARCREIGSKLRVAVLQQLSESRANRVAWSARDELHEPEPQLQGTTEMPMRPVTELEDIPF